MMKIHTTQDLSALVATQKTTNNALSKEFRLKNDDTTQPLVTTPDSFASSVSFGKKKASAKTIKKVLRNIQEKVGDIKQDPVVDSKRGDKFLNSKLFDKMLTLAENEPVMQAAMSALICIILRPLTIMALPSKKGKQDNIYASSHSISSGVMGLVSSLIITQPTKNGAKHVMSELYKTMDKDFLKNWFPLLDVASIEDPVSHARLSVDKWKNKDGKKFIKDLKDVQKLPIFQSFNKISAKSFKAFGADVDWAAYKGKSFNEVMTRDGKSLYDAIDWTKLGIVVDGISENGGKNAEIPVLLRDLDKDFLQKIIEDYGKDTNWKNLDIKSVYDSNNKVVDFRRWKDINGNQWKLDLDSAYISSELDTATYIPRISGKTRIDTKSQTEKNISHQKNGENGGLGSEITQDAVDCSDRNDVHDKIVTWLIDIITRPVVAAGTIALIPLALKKVFHIEKPKKNVTIQPDKDMTNKQNELNSVNIANNENGVSFKGKQSNNKSNNEISFKGGTNKASWLTRFLAKYYAKPLYESKFLSKLADKLKDAPGSMTQHMATLGSLITSGVYVQQTLTNKDLDQDRRKTLAINQLLCFIIPTICAYTVDSILDSKKKKIEYRYSGLQEQKIATLKAENKLEEAKNIQKVLDKKLRGVRTLASLAIFSLIYRYITPVLITPAANAIGDKINENKIK